MKKYAPLLAALVVIGLIFALFKLFPSKKHPVSTTAKAGKTADSFVLAYSGGAPVSLRDFAKKYTTALSFTGADNFSLKYSEAIKKKLIPAIAGRSDIAWFNLEKKDGFFIVSEVTGKVAEKYRLAARQLPASYNFRDLPAVVVVDRTGVIKLIYVGYSPTISEDILKSLDK